MNKVYKTIGGVAGFLGVSFGAFGAHGLKGTLTPEMMEIFKTGVFYQLIHAVVIVALSVSGKKFNRACLLFVAGIILFSFSLYLYTLTGNKLFAMITPVGGVSFLAGWGALILTKSSAI